MAINKTTQYTTNPNTIPVSTVTGSQTLQVALDNRVFYVDTLANMKTLDVPVGAVISLSDNGGGRAGIFDVVSGDFSSKLSNDPQNAIFVGLSDDPTALTKVALRRYDGLTGAGGASVSWFGAVGNFDATLQTGTNDTVAFQAAIDYMASLPNQRNGRGRAILVPAGQYALNTLTLSSALGFGLDIRGEGWKGATGLWFDQIDSVGFDINIEFVKFSNMAIRGGRTVAGNSADRIPTLIKARLPDARADIDIELKDCLLFGATNILQCVGRGAKITGGALAAFDNALVIDSDSANTATNPREIMRHYTISDVRIDFGGTLVTTTGIGVQKSHLLNLQIVDNDFYKLNKLIDSPDATFRAFQCTGNTSLDSFVDGVISCENLIGFDISSNTFRKKFDDADPVTDATDTIYRFIDANGSVINGTITGNVIGQLQDALIASVETAGISISGNSFPNLWEYDGGVSSSVLIRSSSVTDGEIVFTGNSSVSNGGKAGSRIIDSNISPINVEMSDNSFNANIADYWTYAPQLTFGGTPSAKTPTARTGRYRRIGEYIHVDFTILVQSFTETGALGVTLPSGLTPLAVNSSITGTYSGGGLVDKGSGLGTSSGTQPSIIVNPLSGVAEIVTWGSGLESQVSIGSGGTISLFGSFKFKIR